jgi:hypothetical protein
MQAAADKLAAKTKPATNLIMKNLAIRGSNHSTARTKREQSMGELRIDGNGFCTYLTVHA